ncbi:MAG: aspartate aminotransferase family protein [Elusimicrobia bacterium]|nr:aspartate aminotransferase family protein [Elusimicrobiota bacterium]
MSEARGRDRLLTTGAALDAGPLLVIDRARGAFVWDEAGRRYIDALSGCWCVPVGYGRPEVVGRLAAQLRRVSYTPLDWRSHRPALELADALVEKAPKGLERVFFCSGGSEGVATALKLARLSGRSRTGDSRTVFMYRRGSYHGATLGATSVTGFEELRRGLGPLLPDTLEVEPPDCASCPFGASPERCGLQCAGAVEEAIKRLGPGRLAAMVAEPVAAAGRVQVPPAGYWPRVAAALRGAGALLILDEVLTGLGRTGRWFAAEHWGIQPDILVVGKGLAGGVAPLGAVLMTRQVSELFRSEPFAHGFTFGGHPASCAAALATLQLLGGLIGSVEARGSACVSCSSGVRELTARWPASAFWPAFRCGCPLSGAGSCASSRCKRGCCAASRRMPCNSPRR